MAGKGGGKTREYTIKINADAKDVLSELLDIKNSAQEQFNSIKIGEGVDTKPFENAFTAWFNAISSIIDELKGVNGSLFDQRSFDRINAAIEQVTTNFNTAMKAASQIAPAMSESLSKEYNKFMDKWTGDIASVFDKKNVTKQKSSKKADIGNVVGISESQTNAIAAGIENDIKSTERYIKKLERLQKRLQGVFEVEQGINKLKAQAHNTSVDAFMDEKTVKLIQRSYNEIESIQANNANEYGDVDFSKMGFEQIIDYYNHMQNVYAIFRKANEREKYLQNEISKLGPNGKLSEDVLKTADQIGFSDEQLKNIYGIPNGLKNLSALMSSMNIVMDQVIGINNTSDIIIGEQQKKLAGLKNKLSKAQSDDGSKQIETTAKANTKVEVASDAATKAVEKQAEAQNKLQAEARETEEELTNVAAKVEELNAVLNKDYSTKGKRDATNQLRATYKEAEDAIKNGDAPLSEIQRNWTDRGRAAALSYYNAFQEAVKQGVAASTLSKYQSNIIGVDQDFDFEEVANLKQIIQDYLNIFQEIKNVVGNIKLPQNFVAGTLGIKDLVDNMDLLRARSSDKDIFSEDDLDATRRYIDTAHENVIAEAKAIAAANNEIAQSEERAASSATELATSEERSVATTEKKVVVKKKAKEAVQEEQAAEAQAVAATQERSAVDEKAAESAEKKAVAEKESARATEEKRLAETAAVVSVEERANAEKVAADAAKERVQAEKETAKILDAGENKNTAPVTSAKYDEEAEHVKAVFADEKESVAAFSQYLLSTVGDAIDKKNQKFNDEAKLVDTVFGREATKVDKFVESLEKIVSVADKAKSSLNDFGNVEFNASGSINRDVDVEKAIAEVPKLDTDKRDEEIRKQVKKNDGKILDVTDELVKVEQGRLRETQLAYNSEGKLAEAKIIHEQLVEDNNKRYSQKTNRHVEFDRKENVAYTSDLVSIKPEKMAYDDYIDYLYKQVYSSRYKGYGQKSKDVADIMKDNSLQNELLHLAEQAKANESAFDDFNKRVQETISRLEGYVKVVDDADKAEKKLAKDAKDAAKKAQSKADAAADAAKRKAESKQALLDASAQNIRNTRLPKLESDVSVWEKQINSADKNNLTSNVVKDLEKAEKAVGKLRDGINALKKNLVDPSASSQKIVEDFKALNDQVTKFTIDNGKKITTILNAANKSSNQLNNKLGKFIGEGFTKDSAIEKINKLLGGNGNKVEIVDSGVVNGLQRLDTVVTDTTGHYEKFRFTIDETTGALRQQAAGSGETERGLSRIGSALKEFGSYAGNVLKTAISLRTLINAVRQGVGYVKELDTALNELKLVSNASEAELVEYAHAAKDVAGEVASTTSEIIKSQTEWARLGKSASDSLDLAAASAKMARTGFMEVSDATSDLVSIIQAYYNDEISNGFISNGDAAMEISDKLVYIGNNFAITSEGLGSSLQRSAAAMKAAGNDINETIALTTAANLVQQDPGAVGNALKVISMRLRGTSAKNISDEVGESVDLLDTSFSKLYADVKKLTSVKSNNFEGISILTDTGSYKSTYEILVEIARIWDEIDDKSQAALLETMAGKTRGAVVAGILQNGEELERAFEAVTTKSAGATDKAMDIAMDSVDAKLAQLKNSWQAVWQDLLDSGMVKDVIDALIKVADAIDTIVKATSKLGSMTQLVSMLTGGATAYRLATNGGAGGLVNFTGKGGGLLNFRKGSGIIPTVDILGNRLNGPNNDFGFDNKVWSNFIKEAAGIDKTTAKLEDFEAIAKKVTSSTEDAAEMMATLKTEAEASGKSISVLVSEGSKAGGTFKGLGSALKGVGLTLASTLASIAVSIVFSKLAEGLGDFVNRLDIAIDKANKFKEAIASETAQYQSNIEAINGFKDELETLAEGVDEYGNNISLTSDQYERYKSLVAQLVAMDPEIAKSYTAHKGYIIDVKNALVDAADAQEKFKKEAVLKGTYGEGLKEYFNGLGAEYQGATQDYLKANGYSGFDLALMGAESEVTNRNAMQSNALKRVFSLTSQSSKTPITDYLKSVLGPDFKATENWFDDNEKLLGENAKLLMEAISDSVDYDSLNIEDKGVFDEAMGQLDAWATAYQNYASSIESINKDIRDNFRDYLLGTDYEKLDDVSKHYIDSIIDSFSVNDVFKHVAMGNGVLDPSQYDIFEGDTQAINKLQSKLSEQIELLASGIDLSGFTDKLKELPKTMSSKDYQKAVDDIYQQISDAFYDKTGERLDVGTIQAVIDFEPVNAKTEKRITDENMRTYLEDVLKEAIPDDISREKLELAYNIAVDIRADDANAVFDSITDLLDLRDAKLMSDSVQQKFIQSYDQLASSVQTYGQALSTINDISLDNTKITVENGAAIANLLSQDQELQKILASNRELTEDQIETVKNSIASNKDLSGVIEAVFDDTNTLTGYIVKDTEALKRLTGENVRSSDAYKDLKSAQEAAVTKYAELTRKLADATSGTEEFDEEQMANIRNLQSQIRDVQGLIDKYAMLEHQLLGAADGFTKFDQAKQADAANNYGSQMLEMLTALNTGIKEQAPGSETFRAAFEAMIPEDFEPSKSALERASEYGRKLIERGFVSANENNDGFEIKVGNFENFIKAGEDLGVFEQVGDDFREFNIKAGTTLESLADAFGLTETAAFALLSEFQKFNDSTTGSFSFLDDLLTSANAASLGIYDLNEEIQRLRSSISNIEITDDIKNVYQRFSGGEQSLQQTQADLQILSKYAEEAGVSVDELYDAIKTSLKADELESQLKEMETSVGTDETFTPTVKESLDEISGAIDEVIKLYDSTGGYIEENSKAAEELKGKIQECQAVYNGLTDIAIDQQNNIAAQLERFNKLKAEAADIENKMSSLPADSKEYAEYATQLSNINTDLGNISDKLIKIGDPSQYTGVAIDAVDAKIAEQQKIIDEAETRVANIQNLLDHATDQEVISTYTAAKNDAQTVLDNANAALNALQNQKAVIEAIDPESQEQFNNAIDRLNEFSEVSTSTFNDLLSGYDSVIEKVAALQNQTSGFLVEKPSEYVPSYDSAKTDSITEAQERYNQSLSRTETQVGATETSTKELDNTLDDVGTSGAAAFDNINNSASTLSNTINTLFGQASNLDKMFADINGSAYPTPPNPFSNYATGGVATGGRSLVGELGQELVVSNGRYKTVGDRGPEFVHLKKGDIVFNHLQTEQLLKHNRTSLRGRALVSGNAYSGNSGKGKVTGRVAEKTRGILDDIPSSSSKSSASSEAKEWTEAFTKAAEKIKKEFEKQLLEASGYIKTEALKDVEEIDSKILDALDGYTADLQAIKDLGFDAVPDQTVFGNIDLNNRQVLKWTQETVDQFWEAMQDHLDEGSTKEDLLGTVSTVLGGSHEFDGVEIAFTPMLQTESGPVVLSQRTVDDYIQALIENAQADGSGWTNEELFALDTQGLEFDGLQIKNLIADIGETAEQTGKVMHYLGTDGALNANLQTLTKAAQDAGMSLDQYVTKLNQIRAQEQTRTSMQYTSRQIAEAQYFSSLTALYKQYYAQYGQASEENAQKLKDLWTGLHDSYVSELDSQYNDGKISLMSYLSSMKSAYQAFYSNIEGYAQECADAQIAYAQKVRNAYQSMFSGMSTLIGFQIGELTAARDEAVSALENERDAAISAIDEQIEAIDEEIDHYNELIEAVQEEIDEKQKEIDAIRKAAEERKRDLELQKAQYNLARAQNQRTEYVYTAEKGFVYRTNADDEREAREDIRQQEEEQRIAVIELEIEKLEEVIEGYEKKIKELEKEKKALEKQKKALQKYYDEQIKAVQEFYDKQIEGLEKIQKAIERFAKFEELQTAMKILNEFGYTLQDLFSGNINFEQLIRGWADAMAASMGPEAFDSIMQTADLLGIHITELNANADDLKLGAESIKTSTALMTENAEPMKGVAQAFQDAAKGAGELAETSTKMSTAVDTLTQSMTALTGDGTTSGLTAISAAAKELTSADLTAFSNSIQTLGNNTQTISDMAQAVRDIVQALTELQATSGEGGGLTSMITSLAMLGTNLTTISTNLGQFKTTLDSIFGGAMAAAGGQGQAPGVAGQQQGAAGGGGIFGAFLQELDTLVANTDQGVTTMIDKWTEFQELMNAIFGEGGGEGSGGEGQGEGEGGGKGSVENLRTMLQETSTAIDEYMLSGEKSVANSFKNALVEGDGSALGSLQRLHDEGITLVEELKNAIIELLEALNSALEQFGTIAAMAGGLMSFAGGEGGQYTGTATNKWGHYASGTAHNQGTWGLKHNEKNALVGELGPETLIRDGQYYIIGENGPETMSLKKDDIILNHEQTEDVFRDGKVSRNKKLDTIFGGPSHAAGTFGVGSRATAQARGVAAQRNAQASSAAGAPGSFGLLVSQLTALNGAIETLSQANLNDIAEDLAKIQNTNIEMVTTQLQTLSQHATQFQNIALELSNMQMQLQTLSGTDYFTPLNTQFQTFLSQFTVLATQFQTQVQNMFAGLSTAVAGGGTNPAAGGAGAAVAGAGAVGAEAGAALANGAAGAAGGGNGGIFGAFLDQLDDLNMSTDETLTQMTDRWTDFKDDIGTIIGVGEGGGEGGEGGEGGGRKSSSGGGSGEGGEGGSADSIIGVMDLAAETIQDTMLNEHLPMLDELINTGEPSLHSIVEEGTMFIIEQVEYIIEIVNHAIEQIHALLAMGDQIRGIIGGISVGHAAGTAHYAGTALTGGSWGLKRTEHGALVGEIGPETLVRNGRYQIIGEHGPERMNLRKGDIIFNAAQTASIFKYGKVKGASHADGTLASIIPGFTKAAMPDVFEKFVDMLSNIEVNVQKLVPPVNAPTLAAAGVGSVTNTNSTNNNGQTFHVDNLSVTLPNASPDSIEALANDLLGIKAKMLQRFNKSR